MRKTVSALIMAAAMAASAGEIMQDFFPVAVGNTWTFRTRTGLTQIWRIDSLQNKGLVLTDTVLGEYSYSHPLQFQDANGRVNDPPGRNLGGFWGVQAVMPRWNPVSGAWGHSDLSHYYFQVWGHPSGGNWALISAPGVGPVLKMYADMMGGSDTAATLKSYSLKKTPRATDDTFKRSSNPASSYACSKLNGDTCIVTFRAVTPGGGGFYTVSSFNPVTDCLRLYVADTTEAIGAMIGSYEHTVTIVSCEKGKKYRLKIFQTTYIPQDEEWLDSVGTELLFDEQFPQDGSVAARERQAADATRNVTLKYDAGRNTLRLTLPDAALSHQAAATVALIDVSGRTVLRRQVVFSPSAQIALRDDRGSSLASGVYALRVEVGASMFTKSLRIGQ
jgi:hypothetical protein